MRARTPRHCMAPALPSMQPRRAARQPCCHALPPPPFHLRRNASLCAGCISRHLGRTTARLRHLVLLQHKRTRATNAGGRPGAGGVSATFRRDIRHITASTTTDAWARALPFAVAHVLNRASSLLSHYAAPRWALLPSFVNSDSRLPHTARRNISCACHKGGGVWRATAARRCAWTRRNGMPIRLLHARQRTRALCASA